MRSGSRPWVGAVLGLALALVAACGDGADRVGPPAPEVTSPVPPSGESVPPRNTPTASGPTSTAGGSSATSTTVAGEAAPDFILELGNGGTFVLSEEARPVFMVFWAEW